VPTVSWPSPQFEAELRDVVGNLAKTVTPPPLRLSADKKSQIQARQRTQEGLPIWPAPTTASATAPAS